VKLLIPVIAFVSLMICVLTGFPEMNIVSILLFNAANLNAGITRW